MSSSPAYLLLPFAKAASHGSEEASRCVAIDLSRRSPLRTNLSVALETLDEELERAQAALRLMQEADAYLRKGSDESLILLGFSALHIADLRRRAGPDGGYPSYSIRNIEETIRMLHMRRQSLAVVMAGSIAIDG